VSTSQDAAEKLAAEAAEAVGLQGEDRAVALLWANCLLQAAEAAGGELPEISTYRVRGAVWYGFRTGPLTQRSDCGVGVLQGRAMIRVLDRQFGFAVRGVLTAALRIIGADRGDDWYFALDDGDVVISEGGVAVTTRYGQTGEHAIIGAVKSVLSHK
jgi:hypothetical protein